MSRDYARHRRPRSKYKQRAGGWRERMSRTGKHVGRVEGVVRTNKEVRSVMQFQAQAPRAF